MLKPSTQQEQAKGQGFWWLWLGREGKKLVKGEGFVVGFSHYGHLETRQSEGGWGLQWVLVVMEVMEEREGTLWANVSDNGKKKGKKNKKEKKKTLKSPSRLIFSLDLLQVVIVSIVFNLSSSYLMVNTHTKGERKK
jgi:hypothetical protein